MSGIPVLTINMDRKCSACKKLGATDGGLCLKCITERKFPKMKTAEQRQPLLIKPTPEQIIRLREQLSGFVREYIEIEDQKKAADADYNERLGDLWAEIVGLRARITEAEEA